MNALYLWQSVHGYLGVLAVVALLHPAILLRRGLPLSRGTRWSIALTTLVTGAAFTIGIAIYENYRALVKRPLFSDSLSAGLLFETKEHVAYAVLATVVAAGIVALSAPPTRAGVRWRRIAAVLYATAAALCALVVGLGTYVASIRNFGS